MMLSFFTKQRYILSLLLVLTFTGCGVLPSANATAPRTYLLDILPLDIRPASPDGKTLSISMPQATAGFDTAAMVFIRQPYELEAYSESQWIDTPTRLLLPLLVHRLEATGFFGAVLSSNTTSVVAELRLDTEIIRFQQEFLSDPSQIRLTLRIQLFNMASRNIIATKTFEIVEPSPSEDAEGGVIAANLAVKRLLDGIAEFVIAQLSS